MNKNLITILIVDLILIIFSCSTLTFAKYATKVYGMATGHTATMEFSTNIGDTIKVNLNEMIPGSIETYNFKVLNTHQNQLTEVSIAYKIKVIKTNNLPIIVELYKDGNSTNILDANGESDVYIFNNTNEEEHDYEMKIKWDSNENKSEYANLQDTLEIVISSEQYLGE